MTPLKKSKKNLKKHNFEAIGTSWVLEYYGKDCESQIHRLIESFSSIYSRFRGDSLISKISRKEGEYILPESAKKLFDLYYKLYLESDGLFTPLIGNVLQDAGYDPSYSLDPKPLSKPPSWEDSLIYEFPKLIVKKPVLLDFGAGGKGYLIDKIGELFYKNGICTFCIDGSGDILLSNFPSKIGLENPSDFSTAIGSISITNGSICASSGNRRKWRDFHHIISPESLKPINSISSVWVKAKSALIADSISTCLFFIDPDKISEKYEYLILMPDFTFKKSPDFCAELYEKDR